MISPSCCHCTLAGSLHTNAITFLTWEQKSILDLTDPLSSSLGPRLVDDMNKGLLPYVEAFAFWMDGKQTPLCEECSESSVIESVCELEVVILCICSSVERQAMLLKKSYIVLQSSSELCINQKSFMHICHHSLIIHSFILQSLYNHYTAITCYSSITPTTTISYM